MDENSVPHSPLSILALAPLPFLRNGVRTFAQGGPIFNAQLLPRLAQLGHRVRVVTDAPVRKEGDVWTGLQWRWRRRLAGAR